MSTTTQQAETFLTAEELAERYRVDVRTIQNWTAKNSQFPQPLRLSRRAVRYRLSDVLEFERSSD
jgi:predicted DNA-binding transcriptional regulator AlpA